MTANSIAVLPGALLQHRNADAEYPFRQNSNFYYLTGFCEPEAVLVLLKSDSNTEEYILFCRGNNPEEEIWTGPRTSIADAIKHYGADKAFEIAKLDEILPSLLKDRDKIYYSLGRCQTFDNRMIAWVNSIRGKAKSGAHTPDTWSDFNAMIESLRVRKDSHEISLMREAAKISCQAHKHLMKICRPGKFEYELEGEFVSECYKQNARFMAYTPIVAGGKNACILHYIKNDEKLNSKELLLVDAGCEFQYYASDITRTFPINGRFTQDQRAIYELVLAAQTAAIAEVRPGTKWHRLQEIIVEILVRGMIKLGILKGDFHNLIQEKAYRKYYMHSSGHWLGLDVHDAGEYKIDNEWRPLEEGMVLTVEPGLYFTPNDSLDKRWWGIGVRIEDDVLVTGSGCEVLTEGVPKTVAEIEELMLKVT